MTVRILALVGDAFGARGGIARYNRDLFTALASAGAEILVLPRLGDAAGIALPDGVRQRPAMFGKLRFSLVSLWTAWRFRPVDVVFCGHVLMARLAVLLAPCSARATGCRRTAPIWNDRLSGAAPSRRPTSDDGQPRHAPAPARLGRSR